MDSTKITAVEWLSAKDVVGYEASGFTPWLANNLDMLGQALGLDSLVLREVEADVQGKSLDILADGVDQDGNTFPVIIENQYGATDHRHLGQLVTYLAQYGPGYAVWIAESGHVALLTALDFLNRTSPETISYFLVKVRFTHGPNGGHQVDFQVLAQPDHAAKPQGGVKPKSGKTNQDKVDYLASVLGLVKPGLASVGYKGIRMHTNGSYIEMRVPLSSMEAWGARVKVFTNQNEAAVRLYVCNLDKEREQNSAAIDVLRDRYEVAWHDALPSEELQWHGGAEGAVGDFVQSIRSGLGYVGGTPESTAEWALSVASEWLRPILANPIDDLDQAVANQLIRSQEVVPAEAD